jgi:hypothetical protein
MGAIAGLNLNLRPNANAVCSVRLAGLTHMRVLSGN